MKALLILLLLCILELNAQQITITVPQDTKVKAATIYQVKDGYWWLWGKDADGVGNYKVDTAFKQTKFSAWQKSIRLLSDLRPKEIGNDLYQLGVRYDNKAFTLDFVYLNAGNLSEAKAFHTEKYAWKQHGYYGKRYEYLVSPDKQKLLLVWQNPDVTSQYKVFEFDTAFKLLSEQTIETNMQADVKNYTNPFTTADAGGNMKTLSDVTTMYVDGKQNLIIVTRDKKSRAVSIIKYSLLEKKLARKEFDLPEEFDKDFVSRIDFSTGKLYLAFAVKFPERAPILDFTPFTIDIKAPVAQLYTYDIESSELKNIAIKLTAEEIESLLEKGDFNWMNFSGGRLGPIPKNYAAGGLGVSVLSNGSCTLTVSIYNIGGIDKNGGIVSNSNNVILRVYNNIGEQVGGQALYRSRRNSSEDERRFNINGNFYFFTSIYKPDMVRPKLSCYKVDSYGKVETLTYNGAEDVTIFRTENSFTDKIFATTVKGNELRIVDVK